MKPDILFVSNGFGEAAIAGYIANAVAARAPEATLAHFPLVGVMPPSAWPAPVGPQQSMPSGGLVTNWNFKQLGRDLRAGLASLTLRQCRFLTSQRQRDAIVAVGDVYCLALCAIFARRPTIFVATAKSEFVAPHSKIEARLARKAAVTFARDEQTAAALRRAGVNALYAGNVMMDGLRRSGADLGALPGALHVGVLPGSRTDTARNAGLMAQRLLVLADLLAARGRVLQAFFSTAPSVQTSELSAALEHAGIPLTANNAGAVSASGSQGNLHVAIVRDSFADLIDASELVFGQAGTGNEQAAGSGRPVLAAAEAGEEPERMHWYRMRQKRLLGDALLVLPAEPAEFAQGALRLLDDPERLAKMSESGRQRMGGPGGAAAVADAALRLIASTR